MQVERENVGVAIHLHEESGERVSNTWPTYPQVGNNPGKPGLMPHNIMVPQGTMIKGPQGSLEEGAAAD